MDRSKIVNFGAGPSALPQEVLEEAAKGLLNYNGTGIGITELGHRGPEFSKLNKDLATHIRTLLEVPETHEILFTQGGGNGQFSSVVLNLLARHHLLHPEAKQEDIYIDYVVTGTWSNKAAEEASRLVPGVIQNVVADGRKHSKDGKSFDGIPPHDSYCFSPREKTAFIYYCENETVDGVQFSDLPNSPTSFPTHLLEDQINPPLVADYSSSFLSRPIPNLAAHGLIFAGAQKNVGPAGLTILIVRKDLLVDVDAALKLGAPPVPKFMSYKTLADTVSLFQTPPMFPIYISYLVLDRVIKNGGLQALKAVNDSKQKKLYETLEGLEKEGLVTLKVKEGHRSWMNVTWNFNDAAVEKQYLDGAEAQGFRAIKGHRSVGGMRASLYNAITEANVDALIAYTVSFRASLKQA